MQNNDEINDEINTFKILGRPDYDQILLAISDTFFCTKDGTVWRKIYINKQKTSYYWRLCPGSKTRGGIHICIYVGEKRVWVKKHQVIFAFFHGYIPAVIDHIDRDFTNNSLTNLRPSNHRENSKNRKKRRGSVFFSAKRGAWMAYVTFCKKNIYIGTAASQDEAIKMRDRYIYEHGLHDYFSFSDETDHRPSDDFLREIQAEADLRIKKIKEQIKKY